MEHFSLISALCFLPLTGALFLLFIRGDERIVAMNARRVAYLCSGSAFLAALVILARFKFGVSGVQFEFKAEWLPVFGASWHTGVDALSVLFLPLVTGTVLASVIAARTSVLTMVREYMFLTLVFECFLLTALCSRNLIQCFVFYEAAVLPVFAMIALWGVEKRAYSAFKFCFYDLSGSLALLCVLLYAFVETGNSTLGGYGTLPDGVQSAFLAGLTLMLALKAPLFPFHVWYGEIRSEAPVPTSVLLSGALTGTVFFIFLRTAFELAPDALAAYAPYLCLWAVFSALYGAIVALSRDDVGKTAGYVCLSQTGLVAAGMFTLTKIGLTGSLFLCVAASVSSVLYLTAEGALALRFSAKDMKSLSGLYSVAPALGTAFFAALLCLSAFPPTPAFTGEFLVFSEVFEVSKTAGIAAVLSSVLAFSALLPLFPRLILGVFDNALPMPADLSKREKILIAFLAFVSVCAAFYPEGVMRVAKEAARSVPLISGGTL